MQLFKCVAEVVIKPTTAYRFEISRGSLMWSWCKWGSQRVPVAVSALFDIRTSNRKGILCGQSVDQSDGFKAVAAAEKDRHEIPT